MVKKANSYEVNIVLGDWHIPYQDDKALKLVFRIVKSLKPNIITLNGDILDFYALSRFSKDPNRVLSLQEEIDTAYEYLKRLRKENPKAHIIFIDGNHEFRMEKFLSDKAPELYGLKRAEDDSPVHSLDSLLRFKDLKIEQVSSGLKESYYWYGNELLIGHFNRINKHSGYTAKNLLEDKHVSLIQGHTHRLGSSYRTVRVGENKYRILVAYENGCLCGLQPTYVLDPNWQQGFSVVHKKKNDNRFHIQQVPIINYACFFGEREWRV